MVKLILVLLALSVVLTALIVVLENPYAYYAAFAALALEAVVGFLLLHRYFTLKRKSWGKTGFGFRRGKDETDVNAYNEALHTLELLKEMPTTQNFPSFRIHLDAITAHLKEFKDEKSHLGVHLFDLIDTLGDSYMILSADSVPTLKDRGLQEKIRNAFGEIESLLAKSKTSTESQSSFDLEEQIRVLKNRCAREGLLKRDYRR